MIYRAVGDLVAVDFAEMEDCGISERRALKILLDRGFKILEVNLSEIARNFVGGNVKYKRQAKMSEAPMVVNCSTFIKWLYGLKGIWIPRYSLQQRDWHQYCDLKPESLILKTGVMDYHQENWDFDSVGHVGLYTNRNTVIHAINDTPTIVEVSFGDFVMKNGNFRGIRSVVVNPKKTKTLRIPQDYEIETSDDLKYIIWGA